MLDGASRAAGPPSSSPGPVLAPPQKSDSRDKQNRKRAGLRGNHEVPLVRGGRTELLGPPRVGAAGQRRREADCEEAGADARQVVGPDGLNQRAEVRPAEQVLDYGIVGIDREHWSR